ncbi:MAG: DUF2341 domain-containing protein, partial [Candidatus Woesearchaeota archaeon]
MDIDKTHFVSGFAVGLVVSVVIMLLFSGQGLDTPTGQVFVDEGVPQRSSFNVSITPAESPVRLVLPLEGRVNGVAVSGEARGTGTLKVSLTDGERVWTVHEEEFKPVRNQMTGFVVGEAGSGAVDPPANASAVTDNASTSISNSSNQSSGLATNTSDDEVLAGNLSEPAEPAPDNVSEEADGGGSDGFREDASLPANTSGSVKNASVDLTPSEPANASSGDVPLVNGSATTPVNASENTSEPRPGNVSLNGTLSNASGTPNATSNRTVEVNASENVSGPVANESVVENATGNASRTPDAALPRNRSQDNATLGEESPAPVSVHEVEDACLETCSLLGVDNLSLNITVTGNLSFTLEEVSYAADPTIRQVQAIPNQSLQPNETRVLDLDAYFSPDGLFFDTPSVAGLELDVDGSDLSLSGAEDGVYEVFVYGTDGDDTVRSNLFVVNVTARGRNGSSVTPGNASAAVGASGEPVQGLARVGEPVRWTRVLESDDGLVSVEVPAAARDVSVVARRDGLLERLPEAAVRGLSRARAASGVVDEGDVSLEFDGSGAEEFVVEYETPAPVAVEENVSASRKRVTVSSDFHYEDVEVSSSLPVPARRSAISVRWVEEGVVIEDVSYHDEDGDGLVERVSWIAPHLSNQTFEIDIEVLNPVEYLRDGDVWRVFFNTTGSGNLTVWSENAGFEELLSDNETTFDEMDFLDLRCGDSSVKGELLVDDGSSLLEYSGLGDNDSVNPESFLVPDYNCNETSVFEVYMNKAGYAILNFSFSDENMTVYDKAVDPEIDACTTIGSSGYYTMNQSVSSSSGDCFTITVDDVYFDCDGYLVNYTGDAIDNGAAFNIDPSSVVSNITVVNCRVSEFEYGFLLKTINSLFQNITASCTSCPSGHDHGFSIDYQTNNTVFRDVEVYGYGHGLEGGTYSDGYYEYIILEDSYIHNNEYGVSAGLTINNSVVENNTVFEFRTGNELSPIPHIAGNVTGGGKALLDTYYDTVVEDIHGAHLVTVSKNSVVRNISLTNTENLSGGGIFLYGDNVSFEDIYLEGYLGIGDDFPGEYQYNFKPAIITNLTIIDGENIFWRFDSTKSLLLGMTINDSWFEVSNPVYFGTIESVGVTLYNTLFNMSGSFSFNSYNHVFNTSMRSGDRIYGEGLKVGGNYYTNPAGTGYSDTCTDVDKDGFCDDPYDLDFGCSCEEGVNCTAGATDYLPLSDEYDPLSTGVFVDLNSPVDGSEVADPLVVFNCSAYPSNSNLTNVTFYHGVGGWHANETKSLSGESEQSRTFTKTFSEGTDITWNCYACNEDGDCAFNLENYTVGIPVYALGIEDPSEGSPRSVDLNGENITVRFNFTRNGVDHGSSALVNNITVGGTECPLLEKPLIAFQDSFTDSDGTSLPSHTPDVGDNWTQIWVDGGSTIDIQSNRVDTYDQHDHGAVFVTPPLESADYNVSLALTTLDWGFYTTNLVARYQGDGSYYGLSLSSTYCRLYKYDGSTTWLDSSCPDDPANGDVVTFVISGSSLKAYWNGKEQLSATDSGISGAGRAGFGFGETPASSGRLDDQQADDFSVTLHEHPKQVWGSGDSWYANCTVPSGLEGFQDLFLNATVNTTGSGSVTRSDTASNALNYPANPPDKPSLNAPPDGGSGLSIPVVLNVTVTDPDGQTMDVSFYDASDDSQIGLTQTGVANGSWASVTWSGLSGLTTYEWYANVSDGYYTNTSSSWNFTTSALPDVNIKLLEPSGDINVTQNQTFRVRLNASCLVADCGDVEVGLDPPNWWNYSFDKRVDVNVSSVVSSTLSDFPAYINVSKEPDMSADYSDLRFIDGSCGSGDATVLDYEVENYTNTNAHVWVRLPELPSSGADVCLYYDNTSAVSSGEDPSSVWSGDYVMVHHLEDASDSTSNGLDGTGYGGVTIGGSSGVVDGATLFDGSDDYVNAGDGSGLNGLSELTFSAWVDADVAGVDDTIWRAIGNDTLMMRYDSSGFEWSGTNVIQFDVFTTGGRARLESSSNAQTTGWQHLTGVWNGTNLSLYIDGSLDTPTGSYGNSPGTITGADRNNIGEAGDQSGWDGSIDEVRLSSVARSAGWVNQSYQMVASQDSLVSFGTPENASASKGVIPTNSSATPFYTNKSSNPYTLSSMVAGESRDVSFWVNATGEMNSTWEFFAFAQIANDNSVYNESSHWNVSIASPIDPPLYSSFDGSTTDFASLQPESLLSLDSPVLEKTSYGRLVWHGSVDVSEADFDSYVLLGDGWIFVDASALDSSLNSSANITLYNISYPAPVIYRDGELCGDCSVLSVLDGNVSFNVSGFSNYSLGSGSQLDVSDDTDSVARYTGEQVSFFANYSNTTSNEPLNGSGVFCEFREDSSGSWSSPVNMSYNGTSELYEYNKSFSNNGSFTFNVSCYNGLGVSNLSLTDSFYLSPSAPDCTSYPSAFSGSGTSGDPYQVYTCAELQCVNSSLSSSYILAGDIDCSDSSNWNSGEGFRPIAPSSSSPFTGELFGNGSVVSGLFMNGTNESQGLLASNDGYIEKLGLEGEFFLDVDQTETSYFAAPFGSGTCDLEQVFFDGNVTVVGVANGQVQADGLGGCAVSNSYSRGHLDLSGVPDSIYTAAGISTRTGANVAHSYSLMNISYNIGIYYTGGIKSEVTETLSENFYVGDADYGIASYIYTPGTLTNNYFYGPSNCYYSNNGEVTNCSSVASSSYFHNYSNDPLASWDFTNIWSKSREGSDYPVLQWEVDASNSPPDSPSLNAPPDGGSGVSVPALLNVSVSDPDGDSLDVSFFDASDDSQIGSTQSGVANGSWASVTWSGLSGLTTYEWYANVTDGSLENRSQTWNFTTRPPSLEVSKVYPVLDDVNVSQNRFFNVTLNVSCLDGDCGDVNVTLDPLGYSGSPGLDFVSGTDFGDPYRLFLGDGSAGFSLNWSSSETDRVGSVGVGDFDGDGFLDFVSGNDADPYRLFLGDGAGGFSLNWSSSVSDDTESVVVGDFDGDGDAYETDCS